jgi:hypothetical protein
VRTGEHRLAAARTTGEALRVVVGGVQLDAAHRIIGSEHADLN